MAADLRPVQPVAAAAGVSAIALQKALLRLGMLACGLILPGLAGAAEWKATERIETYSVSGQTAGELYASIGARGPLLGGKVRAIAHTNFKLTWTRKYENRDQACVLASAKPKLVITYVLPKPSAKLPPPLDSRWATFIAGVEAHERVHGDQIKQMVSEIETATVGLTVEGDPKCRRIREQMKVLLSGISQAQRQKSRDFDRVELSEGGNIHQLILRLVNGQ